jgi:serine phosphatase RsbU (regulator of sigma subunit)
MAILVALVFVTISYGFISIRNKNQRLRKSQEEIEQANASLEELNQEIYSKNKNITDSILYARGIQEAILPEAARWNNHFPESFVLYKPRDIVSGDFYYLSQIRNKTFVAFADCTGHGVPGALMSLIGHNLLSSSIEIHGNDDPDQILKELDEGIRRTLRNQLSHNRDSMELGLCIFDHEKQQFTFASSMRSLFVYRNGDIEEWRGDRHPLGSDKPISKPFSIYKAPLNTLEAIYLCSDGYQDQLGGPENKRFLSNRLRNLIRSLALKPMHLQREGLELAFEEWKGKQRQLDDVMVIGIRLNGQA